MLFHMAHFVKYNMIHLQIHSYSIFVTSDTVHTYNMHVSSILLQDCSYTVCMGR